MTNPILSPNFLLQSDFARKLYDEYAAHLPIIDYHNHLPPADICSNKSFDNLTHIWLAGDHYKWRAMRTLGISEEYITGSASDEQKFTKWGKTVPYTMRNPLFHWTHLELKNYFGIQALLTEANAKEIYQHCNTMLAMPEFTTVGLLSRMKVETVCTTDDPVDNLSNHLAFSKQGKAVGMYPAFRPDKAYATEEPENYLPYLERLGEAAGVAIHSFDTLMEALSSRIDFFHEHGCRLSDHGLERLVWFAKGSHDPEKLFRKIQNEQKLTPDESDYFRYHILVELCKMYHKKGWVQQFHLGALRNTNSRAFRNLGPDTGFDSIGDFDQALGLSKFLNELDSTDQLSKTILYNLNPRDNEVFATMTGNFNDGSVKGKIQYGSGWWYLDQKDSMENQMNVLSNMGLLSCFVGMLTDSRSFLSFPRHEYFRRILCNLIGKDVADGLLPWDEKWLGQMVSDICYYNAKNYFDFDPKNIKFA
ncbi:glucuronate isomerase [Algoriphagus namhaensis]|uniref:Uronate isomerase n=1 Tax=Algoriphagus namhaensis TaxID=915353 RepID=A0ABV8AUS4_9BACT